MGPIWEGWEPVFPTQFQLLFNQVEDQYEARQIVKWYIHRLLEGDRAGARPRPDLSW